MVVHLIICDFSIFFIASRFYYNDFVKFVIGPIRQFRGSTVATLVADIIYYDQTLDHVDVG